MDAWRYRTQREDCIFWYMPKKSYTLLKEMVEPKQPVL